MDKQSKSKSVNGVKGMPGVNIGHSSLGRDRHVRQVTPDRHPATVRNSNKIKIGTWNTRTMYEKGKLDNVKSEMSRMEINILGLAEVRWTGAGTLSSDNYTVVYSGGTTHERGVGIILDPKHSKALKGYWPVNDRILVVKLSGKPFDIYIIQVYAPTSACTDEDIEKFYEDLEKTKNNLKSQDVKIIMGDFNAKVGSEKVLNVVGPYGIGNINPRGERLIEWCKEHDYVVTNTWFQNHPRRCWTWMSPGDRTRNQIDFILAPKRFRNAILSSKSMPGADCGSDHVPVVCIMRLKLKTIRKSKQPPKFQYHLLKNDDDLKEKFNVSVENKFALLDEITDIEDRWEMLKRSLTEATEEHIPKKKGKEHKKWMTPEILQMMEERRKCKNMPEKYQKLNKQIKSKCNEEKDIWLTSQCIEIECYKGHDSKYFHEKIKDVTGRKPSPRSGCIKSKDGQTLMDIEDKLNRWSEYIQDLFDDDRGPPPEINNDEGPPILKDEVNAAIEKMKPNKAAGPDEIPVEIFDALNETGITHLTTLINTIYNTGQLPSDFRKSVFITLQKKPGATECENHRTISLMSHATKILLRIIMARIRNKLHPEISDTQFGFVPDKSTRNAIFTLSRLMERSIEVNHDIYLCFIDYSKAFDKVRHEKLFEILKMLNIDGKDFRTLRNLYWEQSAAVRIDGEYTIFSEIKRGVRQGCVLSPDLFNIYSEIILRTISDIEGVKVGGRNVNNLRYADDTVLIADSEQGLQNLLSAVADESEAMGLQLNAKKTECMVVSKKQTTPVCNITCKGTNIKQVENFKYLGFTVTSTAKCDSEIKKRIAISKEAFSKMGTVLKSRNIKFETKILIMKTYIWSVLLYGCECWTISKTMEKRLVALEMWFLRRIFRISWTEKISNKEVLNLAEYEPSLMRAIKKRQLEFFGHINRRNGLEKLVLCGKIKGTRGQGRQRQTYMDSMRRLTSDQDNTLTRVELIRRTEDREDWKSLVVNVCARPDT